MRLGEWYYRHLRMAIVTAAARSAFVDFWREICSKFEKYFRFFVNIFAWKQSNLFILNKSLVYYNSEVFQIKGYRKLNSFISYLKTIWIVSLFNQGCEMTIEEFRRNLDECTILNYSENVLCWERMHMFYVFS
jgi:hypothetical protein